MNLYPKLVQLADKDTPIRVGLIGSGKFGSMFLSQIRHIPGMHLLGIADLDRARARAALVNTGWNADASTTDCLDDALKSGKTCLTEDAEELVRHGALDVVIDATGNPSAGIRHALLAVDNGKHMVMVNVEADVLAGAYLVEKFNQAGLVYSMAYGDQPALVCEMIDWARTCGFRVVAAGKGTKYLPSYSSSTPDTVWEHYGLTPEEAAAGGMNPQMFNSFLDGTKSAIEMAAISNASGLIAPKEGLSFPPVGVHDLPRILKPRAEGGILEQAGMVEVVSSEERDGRHVFGDLRWGVYITFEAMEDAGQGADYVRRCFREYQVMTDPSGRYATLFRPSHLIGLELGVSVASAAIRNEPTGTPTGLNSDVVAVAKKPLSVGERLDGEGGYTVWGRVTRAVDSLKMGGLPIGLAHGMTLKREVPEGQVVSWDDVNITDSQAVRVRREMEDVFRQRLNGHR
ncbi:MULTISPECIES: Gfo/Idh/MocA family oxidoreductase [unclassified Halomonas]|uniref:NAD(P)H-dependent oxidoreductase n=1 Tax=unclassified Halomonas TaxID=2609666 RepID=UPI00257B5390|nr:Gfo/Idh/MocA family oxidoreductase [Halomonas sp.]MCJ8284440.1 SAF domain-containing protein [Halomonas sp.]NQY69494.1 Gfo/Idh/MocA family oxidoreductase [Halomonas sp.]